jgi:hypothetical protein
MVGRKIEAERLEKRHLHLQCAAGKACVAILAGGHAMARNDSGSEGLAGFTHWN